MPRPRTMKSIALEVTIVIVFVAIIGHSSVNFWERFLIQNELTQMKTSLQFLKNTLTNIGSAYDKLHQDLKGLVEYTDTKQSLLYHLQIPQEEHKCKNKYTLTKPKHTHKHDIQVGAMIEAKNAAHNFPPKAHKTTEKQNVRIETRNAAVTHVEEKIVKNMTTMTKYPPKSVGVGDEVGHQNNSCRYKCYQHYSCFSNPFTYWTCCEEHH